MHGRFVGTAKWTAIEIKGIAIGKTVRRVVSRGIRINGKGTRINVQNGVMSF